MWHGKGTLPLVPFLLIKAVTHEHGSPASSPGPCLHPASPVLGTLPKNFLRVSPPAQLISVSGLLFGCCCCCFNSSIVNIQCCIRFTCTIEWFSTCTPYSVLINIRVILISFTYFTHLPPTSSLVTSGVFSIVQGPVPFVLIYFFVVCFSCFLNSTYKWNRMLFVFLWLTSFTYHHIL